MKPKVDKQVYTGLCLGGPWDKQVINSVGDRNFPVAKMEHFAGAPREEWTEARRGLYQYDVGIWWWRGWEKR